MRLVIVVGELAEWLPELLHVSDVIRHLPFA